MALVADRARRLFTLEEYRRMVEAGILRETDRVELIDGEILEMSPRGTRHWACVANVTRIFVLGVGTRAVVSPQNAIEIPPSSAPEPDLAVVRPRSYKASLPVPDDVLLIIEVADTSLRFDRTIKLSLYARARVREYWIADVTAETVTVFRQPTSESYTDTRVVPSGSVVSPLAFPDLLIPVADLFA